MGDRGDHFDGVKLSRPAVDALVEAGYETLSDLPDDLATLLELHGFGPKALRLLKAARGEE